jgi:hypothetical protein
MVKNRCFRHEAAHRVAIEERGEEFVARRRCGWMYVLWAPDRDAAQAVIEQWAADHGGECAGAEEAKRDG